MDTEGIDIGHAPHGIEHERRLKCLRPRERARRGVGRADWNRLPAGNVRIAEQVVIEIPAITTKRPGELVKLALRGAHPRSEEHTSELQSLRHLVCRLLLEK